MKIFALADLHLSFSVPEKSMEFFGPIWKDYSSKIEKRWKEHVGPEDLVLLPGDLSWAISLEGALIDLMWIDSLPGTKVILKGNHDYWWGSLSKLYQVLPKSIHPIQNNVFNFKGITIGGTRLWDNEELDFSSAIDYKENPHERPVEDATQLELQKKIFERELLRLKLSLDQLDPKAALRICMTHYPPVDFSMHPNRVTKILEEYKIDIAVFGHLHALKNPQPRFGKREGVEYIFTACDAVDFTPVLLRTL